MTIHETYMHHCLALAKLGAGYVAPNPMVGAVLLYNGKIIGEGYHGKFGEAHAEVNCLNSVKQEDKKFISLSTLYVSLEPCAHFGKTPPCTDLIIQNKIPEVVIGCLDPSKEVNGMGMAKLKAAGINVEVCILEKECKEINKRFFTFHTKHRPYIILKWAETADGFIATSPPGHSPKERGAEDSIMQRLLISNENTNHLVHKWRSEEASILVGTNTALHDDPELTNRLWPGPSPIRLVVDMDLKLPDSLNLFNNDAPTIIFNKKMHSETLELPFAPYPLGNVDFGPLYYLVKENENLLHQIVNALYKLKIQSIIVEGGARLLQSFIDEGIWDEIIRISNKQLAIGKGLAAPVLPSISSTGKIKILDDEINIYLHEEIS